MNNEHFDQLVFGKKTFSDLLKDIYDTNKKTEKQISELIITLKPMIKTASDAVMIVPLIKQYMEVKVANDEHMVKMCAIVQRAVAAGKKDEQGNTLLSDEEQKQLLLEVQAMSDSQSGINFKTTKLIESKG
jgi:hypothetical protein